MQISDRYADCSENTVMEQLEMIEIASQSRQHAQNALTQVQRIGASRMFAASCTAGGSWRLDPWT